MTKESTSYNIRLEKLTFVLAIIGDQVEYGTEEFIQYQWCLIVDPTGLLSWGTLRSYLK